jgi:outer membrane lipoprotein SlyB
MKRKKHSKPGIGTPPAERFGNVATGAVIGAVVGGPVGAVAGAAVGAMVEKGMPRTRRRTGNTNPTQGNTTNARNRKSTARKVNSPVQ